jgi:hypothetical protein
MSCFRISNRMNCKIMKSMTYLQCKIKNHAGEESRMLGNHTRLKTTQEEESRKILLMGLINSHNRSFKLNIQTNEESRKITNHAR